MVVLDLSSSMLASDIKPSRLQRAKREIVDLLAMMQGDRIGILAFAGVSFVQCPLTTDYRMAHLFIDQLDISLMPVQGTRTGEALIKAIDHLDKSSKSDSQGKSIILMTDGEDQGSMLSKAIKRANDSKVKIYAIGIGAESGAPIPLKNGGFKKDRSGNVIISKLDESSLKKIAIETGAIYVRSTTGDMDLDRIYKRSILAHNEASPAEEVNMGRKKIWYERYQWFLLLAILALFLEFLINQMSGASRKKK